jgi:GDP-L-fucose synthase
MVVESDSGTRAVAKEGRLNREKVFVAGHKGLVGSAVVRRLKQGGYTDILTRTRSELNLENQADVAAFFAREKPGLVILAAAKVGGIWANKTQPAEFIFSNLSIAVNVVDAARCAGVRKLIFLGSSCIYPKLAPQPLREEYLLTSPLEPTNEAYAIAKIAGLKMCRYYNEQYGTNFISVMPTNLFGPNDNYDLESSHVLPAMIRKFHLARSLERNDWINLRRDLSRLPIGGVDGSADETGIRKILESHGIIATEHGVQLTLWGSGSPKREFLYVDDLADALVFLMENFNYDDLGEVINIGSGEDLSIRELAEKIAAIVGFSGAIKWDATKPDGTPRKLLDVSQLRRLGWSPRHGLESAIRATCTDYRFQSGYLPE